MTKSRIFENYASGSTFIEAVNSECKNFRYDVMKSDQNTWEYRAEGHSFVQRSLQRKNSLFNRKKRNQDVGYEPSAMAVMSWTPATTDYFTLRSARFGDSARFHIQIGQIRL